MSRLALIARTVPRLGLGNVARVALYRLRLKSGWRPQPLQSGYPGGALFDPSASGGVGDAAPGPATMEVFGWHDAPIASPPDWHADCIADAPRLNPDQDWTEALAGLGGGDVKPYWELSRFYWLPQFALAARDGDTKAAATIEHWLRDWIEKNPPFRGINWSCGQEAAIRLMNLALSALILDVWHNPTPAMKWLIETHARRVNPTLSYAIGQDNNHGTAEACANFIAGSWGEVWAMPGAAQIVQRGRKWLNHRALRMIQADGSPCQYSTTYHRANLEGFNIAGLWSARTGHQGLRDDAEARVVQGARWLHAIIDEATGDAPNLGANDGSHLFSVPKTPYRDFRPTVALAAALFDDARAWPDYADPRLAALGLVPSAKTWSAATSQHCKVGGFHILRRQGSFALMHYPNFRFRPSQADVLHVDLWHDGTNLLRDAGTYSYTADGTEWFSGTAAHNTVMFDARNQMPRIGRFLFGDWLKAEAVEPVMDDGVKASAAAQYTDARGARHHRAITLSAGSLICVDTISGNFQEACLRWRLAPGDWIRDGDVVRSGNYSIALELDGGPILPTLGTTSESRYYLQKTEIPEVSAKVSRPGRLVTKVSF